MRFSSRYSSIAACDGPTVSGFWAWGKTKMAKKSMLSGQSDLICALRMGSIGPPTVENRQAEVEILGLSWCCNCHEY
jgi:hypothetical protein